MTAVAADQPDLAVPPQAAAENLSAYVSAQEDREHCRSARLRFMQLHAEWVYASLHRSSAQDWLSSLAYDAAALVPGLTPTREQIARERSRSQADKEGLEIDQGIFFHGLLLSPTAGADLIERMLQPSERARNLLPQFLRDGRLILQSVRMERVGRAAHITLHNDQTLNAEDDILVEDLETAVDLALLDDGIGVGILRGGVMSHPRYAGRRVFCAGINLKHLAAGKISFIDFLLRRELGFLNTIYRGEKPWIAAVDSFAIGGGAQMLLVCDRVIASAGSTFSLPAAREGIVPGLANLRLPRIAGARLARQIILSGRQIGASEPEAQLLFDEIVEDSAMDAAIEASAAHLDSAAVVANRRMLRIGEEPPELFRKYMAEFALEQSRRLHAPDVLEKRWRA